VKHRLSLLLVAGLGGVCLAPSAQAHLLITEVGYDTVDETSPTSEYVEIFNPDPTSVSLAGAWLVGDEDAYPYLVNGPVSPITLNNFIHRFPPITIAPGEIVVVCQDSDAFLAEFFPINGLADFLGQPGSQRLLEVTQDGSGDGVADMIPWGSNPAGTLSMANNGECVGLVTWDGASDLVKDVDWTCWLTTTFIPNKDVDYPLGIDGPDSNLETSFFANDLGTGLPAPDSPQGSSIHRASVVEKNEVSSGGNGTSGHDETSEDWSGWQVGGYSPGICALSTVAVSSEVPASDLSIGLAGPHPFRGSARIRYVIPRSGRLRVTIHDLQGREIADLFEGPAQPGAAFVEWNGCDRSGRDAGDGVYFARLEWNGLVRGQRLVRFRG